MSASILLIEDHQGLAETLLDMLESKDFVVDYANNGVQGLRQATQGNFDVIILDVMLPGLDGYEICRRLRADYHQDTPILMLTARDTLDDKLTGFAAGADDYLIKPFAMDELLARLDAMINRRKGRITPRQMRIDDLVLDPAAALVMHKGQTIHLSPTCFTILRILMRESPAVVPRQVIEEEVWGDDVPDSDALRSNIYTLRKQIDRPFGTHLIHTVKHRGYQLSGQAPEKH